MATSSNNSNVNAGGVSQTGSNGSITGGGNAGVVFGPDFVGPPTPAELQGQTPSAPVETGYQGGGNYYGDYSAQAAAAALQAQAEAAAAAAAARAEAERKAAENTAKRQGKDRKIAEDTQKAQREKRNQEFSHQRYGVDFKDPVSGMGRSLTMRVDPSQHIIKDGAVYHKESNKYLGHLLTPPAKYSSWEQYDEIVERRKKEEEQARNSVRKSGKTDVRRAPNGVIVDNETGEVLEDNSSGNSSGLNIPVSIGPSSSTQSTPRQPRGATIGRAGETTPGSQTVSGGSRVPGYNAPTNQPAQPQATGAPRAPRVPKAPDVPREQRSQQGSTREQISNIFYSQARQAEEGAQRIVGNYNQWVEQHPMANGSVQLPEWLQSEEAFVNEAEPLMKSNYRTFDDAAEREDTGLGTKQKDTTRQDKMIDNLVKDMKLGYFHVDGERVSKDGQVRWSEPVENAMINLMDYLGLSYDMKGQRTIFRLVRMYASMGVDSNGNMFKEGEKEWSLTEQEFVDICRMIQRSCIEHGHPMAMPNKRYQLRGTDIYPSGVMPKVVAKAITGPNSNLQMSPADLVQLCQDEWNGRTYPTMKVNLRNDNSDEGGQNEVAQRISIERMQQALSRLDGVSTEDFSRRYGVDTTLHYKLSEYQDQLAEYATIANGNYDADAVAQKLNERIEHYKLDAMKQKGVNFRIDSQTDEIVIEGQEHTTWVGAGANLLSAIAKTNSIISRPVLALASIPEKAFGNFRTNATIMILNALENDGQRKYSVDESYSNRMKTEEAVKALDAAKMLFEIGGPGAARLFAQEGKPCTHENVTQFLREKYLKDPASGFAGNVTEALNKLQRWSQKFMVGDLVFKKSDTVNWFNALLLQNAVIGNTQDKLAQNGEVDTSGAISLTGDEIQDIMDAHGDNIAMFFTEMLGTDAGISAYNMMRANSIAQVNPVSYYTDRFLRDHGVTNMMITMFIDTFPSYGLNFIYNIAPFSRTIAYLGVKKTQSSNTDNALTNVDLVIGGNMNDTGIDFNDPGFQAGLKMNLMFDAMTFGHNLLVGGILGLAFLALGFEPPDDDENIFNVSMWKIGGKEIQWAWWLNDLTLLGMPFAYYIAAGHKTGDWQLAGQLMLDSLHDQVDGNVVLDFADIISNWRYDLMEFEQMSKDPAYTGPTDMTSFALAELYSNLLRAGNKITPGAPLFDSISRSALVRGIDARAADPRHVFKHSTDADLDKWYKEHQVTEGVQSYFEMLDRKYSTGNWLYALANNARYGVFGNNQKTGFFWWEMPVRTMGDPLAYVWAGEFDMDYDNMDAGMSREQYDAEKARRVLDYIQQFTDSGMNAADAVKNYGFILPEPIRKATLNYLYDELRTLDDDWVARNASGELADKNDYQVAKGIYYGRRSDINTLIYDWLKNDDIPEWGTEYEQLLTDYDITYVYKDSGKPVPASVLGTWVSHFDPNVEPIYKPKGNHPTSLLPWTEVDYSDNVTNRGYNAETVPYWWREGMTGSDAEALRNLTLSNGQTLADQIIPMGRDTGEKLGDVLFGMQNSGRYSNPDEPTIGWRAYVPRKTQLSDDIRDFGKDYENQWNEQKKNISNAAWSGSGSGRTTYPSRSYARSGSYGSGGYSRSSNYNPKIYATKAYSTHTQGTHISSTRTNVNSRSLNADRAATMYTKQPNSTKQISYLRPSFVTKGSREAYRRQDI